MFSSKIRLNSDGNEVCTFKIENVFIIGVDYFRFSLSKEDNKIIRQLKTKLKKIYNPKVPQSPFSTTRDLIFCLKILMISKKKKLQPFGRQRTSPAKGEKLTPTSGVAKGRVVNYTYTFHF